MPAEGAVFRRRRLAACLTSLFTCMGGAAPAEESPPVRIRLLPPWVPQAQFAGYYLAREKGFYARRGLDVEVLRGALDGDPAKALEAGQADFAILWLASALSAVDRGVPLVHVAQVFRSSHLTIVAWKDRGVSRVADLDGRRISVWGGPLHAAFAAFFQAKKVAPVVVPQYATVNLFLLRGVDACSVMDYNEYHAIYLAGVDESELVRFRLRDHGIDFPEDGLYCLRRTREERPEVARALVEGTLEGWKYAADHEEEALGVVMERVREANLPTNRAHMRWMLRAVLKSVFPEEEAPSIEGAARARQFGVLSRRAYDDTVRWLVELKVLRSVPSYEQFTR